MHYSGLVMMCIFLTVAVPCSRARAGCIEGNCVNGKGTYVWNNGNRYEGEWLNGRRNGRGTFLFANGEKYEGEFKNDVFHGTGTYTFKNGDVYTGQWHKGKQEGHGVHISSDGTRVEGTFRDGILVQDFDMSTEDMPEQETAPAPAPVHRSEPSERSKPAQKSADKPAPAVQPSEQAPRPSRRDHDIVKPPSR